MPHLAINPITSASQYGLAQAVASGTSAARSSMTPAVAREMIDRTPARLRRRYAAELAERRKNLAPAPRPGSRGYDVVIGARRKHFDSHAAAHRYGTDQQNKGVHALFVIVDSATGKREEFKRSGAKGNPPASIHKEVVGAAKDVARRGGHGYAGESLPNLMSGDAVRWINDNQRVFQQMVSTQRIILSKRGILKRNVSYRKTKKEARKAQRSGALEPGPMFQKWRKVARVSKRGKKRNPEAAAVEMYEKFHGKPSKRIDTVVEDIHVHEHLAALGDLIEMKVKTIKGETFRIEFDRERNPKTKGIARHTKAWLDRRFKAISGIGKSVARTWINPRKANPKGPATLASNEKGTALFIVGGDQKLDLAALGLKEFADKESVIVGAICTIDYFTTKNFGEGDESFIYTHKMNEDTGGPRPMLRYDTVNHRCHIDGGLYHIEKPMLGTSPGLEN